MKKGWSVLPKVDFSLSFDGTLDDEENLFLGTMSPKELDELIHKYGIWKGVEDLGFIDLHVLFDLRDPFVHKLHLMASKSGVEYKLIELCMRRITSPSQLRTKLNPEIENPNGSKLFQEGHQLFLNLLTQFSSDSCHPLNLLVIEWIRMENPTVSFHRDPLPGQTHPGLGLGRAVENVIYHATSKFKRDGVANIPAYFHNAHFYSLVGYVFGNPQMQGAFLTLEKDLYSDLKKKGMSAVSFAFIQGRVKLSKSKQIVIWVASEQLIPVSHRMDDYLKSSEYCKLRDKATKRGVFYIDWDCPLPSEEELRLAIPFNETANFF